MAKRNKRKQKQKNKPFRKWKLLFTGVFFYALALLAANVYRHPSLLLTPISDVFVKTPIETWVSYQAHFQKSARSGVSPQFLAALAQTESMGNPLALTDWRVQWDFNPLKWFRPMSTATGLMQVTSPTWDSYLQYCWRGEKVLESQGSLCLENSFRFRFSAKDSIYLSTAWFKKNLSEQNFSRESEREKFVSVLHLCGKEKAKMFVKSGFSWKRLGSCGAHKPIVYYKKILRNKAQILSYLSRTRENVLAQN